MGIGFAAVGWAFAEAEISGVRQWVPAAAVASAALICGLLSVPGASREVIQAAELLAFWLAARNLGGWMPHRWLAWLGRRTMEIYLLHGPWVLHLVTAALLIVHRPAPVLIPFSVAASVAGALAVAAVLRRLGLAWTWGGGTSWRVASARRVLAA